MTTESIYTASGIYARDLQPGDRIQVRHESYTDPWIPMTVGRVEVQPTPRRGIPDSILVYRRATDRRHSLRLLATDTALIHRDGPMPEYTPGAMSEAEHERIAYGKSTALDAVAAATGARAVAETAWREAIRAAVADGQRVVDVAEAAGISRERVYQIRDGRR